MSAPSTTILILSLSKEENWSAPILRQAQDEVLFYCLRHQQRHLILSFLILSFLILSLSKDEGRGGYRRVIFSGDYFAAGIAAAGPFWVSPILEIQSERILYAKLLGH